MDMLIGVDLGQMQSFAAVAALSRTPIIGPDERVARTSTGAPIHRYSVAGLRRHPLGTSYASVVEHLVEQARRSEMGPRPKVVLDGSGVGVPVCELVRTALKASPLIEVWSLTITSGASVTEPSFRQVRVAKIEIVSTLRAALETDLIRIPPELPFAADLRRELADLRVKITDASNEVFGAEQGSFDDLVMAVALPIWLSTWLDSRGTFIAGPASRVVVPENTSPAMLALTQGGRVRLGRRPGGVIDPDRAGWRPVGTFPLAPRGGSGIFGDPNR
jgi:hypothetical protein